MFGLKLKYFLNSSNIIVRNLRNRRRPELTANPGLNKRVKAFQEQGIKIEDEDAEEFLEKSNSSFYNVGEAYNEHLNETLIGKYDLQHKIVKEKYFKENMPNLLTWSEKEQIRHLATTQPDEWTPQRIAESFPVTVPVVKKLLKYPWKPATEQRIARHDASAMRNWRELKEGNLNIPEDLRKHFLKFSERQIPPLNQKSIKVDLTQTEKLGEFEQIIQRCAQKDNTEKETEMSEKTQHNNNNERSNKKVIKDPQRMTLEDLTARIKERLESGSEVDTPDRIIIDTVHTEKSKLLNNKEIDLISYKQETDLKEYKESDKSITAIDYPERIRIPKKAYKKGATYKIKDCYYDHDGRFLYRVLGLSE
ncbi:uncharacterized protein LOC106712510 isoform X1 [Papilio machaon]|uniref:uncharacterized protein LOC106712510 isoform X1 n=1 Tax=Papilio machaon TaxID=76193 RepID=UPI001E665FF4|nr:uncharacterized protein LOC106712510 isoform X1 [Papilio machaon]